MTSHMLFHIFNDKHLIIGQPKYKKQHLIIYLFISSNEYQQTWRIS